MAEAAQTPAAPAPTKKELEAAEDRKRIEMTPGNALNPKGELPWPAENEKKKPLKAKAAKKTEKAAAA